MLTREVSINQEVVELYRILKFEGLVPSGGAAKQVIGRGEVSLNGVVETRKRKKIVAGDIIEFDSVQMVIVHCPADPSD